MKKISLIILLIISSFFISACNKGSYEELNYKQLMKKIEKEESFVLTLGAASCINCEIFRETIEEINKKYKITTYYIDLDKLDEDQSETIKKLFPFSGTPTTINIVKGKEKNILSRIVGAKDYITVKEKLISWNYIKE